MDNGRRPCWRYGREGGGLEWAALSHWRIRGLGRGNVMVRRGEAGGGGRGGKEGRRTGVCAGLGGGHVLVGSGAGGKRAEARDLDGAGGGAPVHAGHLCESVVQRCERQDAPALCVPAHVEEIKLVQHSLTGGGGRKGEGQRYGSGGGDLSDYPFI